MFQTTMRNDRRDVSCLLRLAGEISEKRCETRRHRRPAGRRPAIGVLAVGIALVVLVAPSATPVSAQTCDLDISFSLPNPLGVDGFVIGSFVEATITLENTSPSFPLEVLDASPSDGNPDITGFDFYPSCTQSTNDIPPTPCPFDEGEFGGPQPSIFPFADGTVLTAFCGPAANPTNPVSVEVNLTNDPGLPLGEKVEFDFMGGLTLPVGHVCELGFQVQVQNFGQPNPPSPSGRNLIFQQSNVAGFCVTGGSPLNTSGTGFAGFQITDLPPPILTVDKVCDAADPVGGTYTYTVSAANDSPPGNLSLKNCVVEDPGTSCDGASLGDLFPGAGAQSVTCVGPSPENTARVRCQVADSVGVFLEEEAFGVCRICDTRLDRQVSCDGGATWVDAGPGGGALFDDGITQFCSANVTGPVKVRWMAVNNSTIGNLVANVDCNLTDGNPAFASTVDMAGPVPTGIPGVIAETTLNQCFSVQNGESSGIQAVLACDCFEANNEVIFATDTDDDTAGFMCTESPSVTVSKVCDAQDAFGNNAVSITVENTGDADLVCQIFDSLAGLLQDNVALPVGGGPLVIPATVSGLQIPTLNEVSVGCVSAATGASLPTAEAADLCEVNPPSFTIDKVCEAQDAFGDNAVAITLTNTGGADLECQVFDSLAGFLQNGVLLPVGGSPVVLNTTVSGLSGNALNEVMAGCSVVASGASLPTQTAEDLCEALPPGFTVAKVCEEQDALGNNAIEITLTNTGGFDLECQVWDPLANFLQNGVLLPAGGSPVVLNTSVSGLTGNSLNEVLVGCLVVASESFLPTQSAEDLARRGRRASRSPRSARSRTPLATTRLRSP